MDLAGSVVQALPEQFRDAWRLVTVSPSEPHETRFGSVALMAHGLQIADIVECAAVGDLDDVIHFGGAPTACDALVVVAFECDKSRLSPSRFVQEDRVLRSSLPWSRLVFRAASECGRFVGASAVSAS